MKKKFFVAVATLCLVCVTGVLAQEPQAPATPPTPPTPEQMAKAKTERLTQRLNLTDDQARKVYDVCLKQAKDQIAMYQKNQALREERAEKMKSILTTEQFMQWAQMQGPAEMAGPHARHHHHDARVAPKDAPKDAPKGDGRMKERKNRE